VTLSVRNREIQMSDGETLGREIRSIIIETGGDEDDAVRIHREHVRFEYENGQFHLVDLGVNPTVVNGDRLEQGDRVPVSTGDRIELSDVAQLRVVDA
jgi:pSer/pThr/pTyr-binding forkhead associated (FHA) protein